jgi:carboxypeptidase Q
MPTEADSTWRDVMQSLMIEARFAYNAATPAEMLPRIPTPVPDPNS